MKALSLTQPWATLVSIDAKRIETRSWQTRYKGLIAIHASKGFPQSAREYAHSEKFQQALAPFGYTSSTQLPTGVIIAVAHIVRCVPTDDSASFLLSETPDSDSLEYAFGDYSPGRFMWFLEDIKRIPQPIPCKGALSLWDVPADIERQIKEQLQ